MKEYEEADDVRQAFVFHHALLTYETIQATDIISLYIFLHFFFIGLLFIYGTHLEQLLQMKSFTETHYSAHPKENLTASHIHLNPRQNRIALFLFFSLSLHRSDGCPQYVFCHRMSLCGFALSHGGLLKLSFVPSRDLWSERDQTNLIGPIVLSFPPCSFDGQDKAV